MKILNRKNDLVDYDEEKLFSGIIKAAEGTKEEQAVRNTKHIICQTVLDLLQTKVKYPTISDITKTIPEALMKLEFYKTANNFIQYATIHKLERSIHKIDPITTIDEYINKQDWRVKANANQGYSLGGMILNASGKMSANYWLDNIYPEDAGFAHRNGDIHIHDLDMISGYCAGWSLKNLLNEGFNGIEGKIEASAPKNLSSAMGQMVNFLGSLQNEFAGAQAFSSFDTYLAPFVRKRKLELEKDYEECCWGNDENHTNYLNVEKQKEWVKKKLKKEVLQQMQVFIYNLNVPSRWGCVDTDTEVLTPKGWKTKDQLKQGDEIYSINMKSKQIEKDLVKAIIEKDSDGKLYEFSNRDYLQRVTENHRVLTFEKDTNNYKIEIAKDLINRILKTSNPLRLPITCEGINQEKILSDDEVKLAAFLYTDGSFEKRHGNGWRIRWRKSIKKWGIEEFEKTCANLGIEYTKDYKESEAHIKDLSFKTRMNHYTITSDNAQKVINIISNKKVIDEKFFKMTRDQARMFLDIWFRTDGQIDRHICQCDNEDIVNGLQHIAILAGYCTRIQKKHRTTWVKISRVDREITCPSKVKEIEYTGKVWCPSVLNNGTAVFRRNGFVFISGQTQTPFTNVTFDIKCPDMLKTQVPMIGGIPVDQLEEFKGKEFTYGDLEDEMTLITQCYFEVMAKGDSKGQIFTFPIPTINIGKSFDWNNPELDEMWEAEAKYGLAYFQNFVNSDLDESMIRSMCITGDSLVDIKVKSTGEFLRKIPIQKALEDFNIEDIQIRTSRQYKDIAEKFIYDVKEDLIKVTLEDGKSLTMTKEHPFLVYNDKNELKIVKAEFLQEGMKASCSGMSEEAKLKSSQTKKAGFASGKYKGLKGELNPMFGKHLSEDQKLRMSLKLKGHNVTENCRKKSSERWSGINNPVAKQEYWDRKDFKFNNKQISPYEKLIKDELESIGVIFKYQKVFNSEKDNKSYVADFYLPEKNLVLELESKCDEKVYLNECPLDFLKEKFDYYQSQGLNVLIFNAAKCNTYRTYINKTVKIAKIEKVYTEGKVYDVRIKRNKKTDFITEDFFANGILTHNCCRLQLDLHELLKRGNGLFGSAEQTGSIGVVTINCARLGYLSKGNKEELYNRLDILLELCKKVLEAKRKFLTTRLKDGFYPFAKRYLGTWRNHFNTIGVNGINEMLLNFNGTSTADKEGIAFAEEFLEYIRSRLKEFQEETGNMYNLEATPGEGTCYRFAKEDKKQFGDKIIQAGMGENIYYNNSSQLPVGFTDDIFEALDLQEGLQRKYTGGSVLHLFLGERVPNGQVAKNIIRRCFEKYKIPYLTLTPTFSICPKHGYIAGEHEYCPICDEKIIQTEKCKVCK